MKIIGIICIFSLCAIGLFAQQEQATNLKSAIDLYESGMYKQAAEQLQKTLETTTTTEVEKELALKYLIASQMEMDELEQAEQFTRLFLSWYPIYQIASTDPLPFVKALNRFQTKPVIALTFRTGLGKINPKVLHNYSVWEAANYTKPYQSAGSFNVALGFQWQFYSNWLVTTEFAFVPFEFSRSINTLNDFELTYTETSHLLRIPLMIGYSFPFEKKWNITLWAGGYYSRLTGADANLSLRDIQNGQIFEKNENAVPVLSSRNVNNGGLTGALTIGYLYKRFEFSVGTTYCFDFKEYTHKSMKYSNDDLIIDFHYIDDDLKLRSMVFNVGIKYNLLYKTKSKYQ